MDTLEAIFTRRSIRKYTSQSVSEADIQTLLEAGMYAPSAGNQQPWHFIVITDRAILDQIPTVHPYAKMLLQAPLAILVCANKKLARYPEHVEHDCAAAVENILLAARALGLGSVWLGVYPNQDRMDGLRSIFPMPDHVVPSSLIAVGYADETPVQPDRFKPERIHLNHW